MVILHAHHPHGEDVAHEVGGQLELEAEGLEVGALHPHVLGHNVAPEAKGYWEKTENLLIVN